MPFLNSLGPKRRMRTELGYSPTCYASMFTGVRPNKHLLWFTWKFSPDTSPYKWITKSNADKLPDILPIRYFCFKVTRYLHQEIPPWHGQMNFTWWYTPMPHWKHFDLAVKKHWSMPYFVENYRTVFDILKAKDIPYDAVEIEGRTPGESFKIAEQYTFDEVKPWTYLFIGDIDPLSHAYGQDSPQVIERLREIDSLVARKYETFQKKCDDFSFILFSDHGHMKIKEKIDLKSFFASHGEALEQFICFIDANFARFRFNDPKEEEKVRAVLANLEDKGFILTQRHFNKYHVIMPDNRYGDLIFYLDAPYAFDHGTKVGWKRMTSHSVSMHGHLPDYPDCDGILIANKELRHGSYVELIDIMPTVLDTLDIQAPSYVEGKSVWSGSR